MVQVFLFKHCNCVSQVPGISVVEVSTLPGFSVVPTIKGKGVIGGGEGVFVQAVDVTQVVHLTTWRAFWLQPPAVILCG